jgi:hypothetical protein
MVSCGIGEFKSTVMGVNAFAKLSGDRNPAAHMQHTLSRASANWHQKGEFGFLQLHLVQPAKVLRVKGRMKWDFYLSAVPSKEDSCSVNTQQRVHNEFACHTIAR